MVDVEAIFLITILDDKFAAVFHGIADLGKTNATVLEEFAQVELMVIAHLNHHTRILGKECLHHIAVSTDVVQVDVHTATCVGKAHLQERGNQSAGRDVMTSHDPSFLDEFLDGIEAIGKIFSVLHCRHIVANLSQTLCKCRTAQPLLVEREVNMIDAGVLVVHQYRAHHFLDV